MIVINENIFPTRESIDELIELVFQNSHTKDMKEAAKIFEKYINECYEADIRLQEMVSDRLSNDFISFVLIPTKDTELLDSFDFSLVCKDSEIKKRDELIYRDLCDICFGGITTYYRRLINFFDN